MLSLRDMPIKQKLMVISMSVTASALLFAGLGIIILDSFLFRKALKRDVSALGQIVAENTTAALAFDDSRAATETLASLRVRPHLRLACIYRLDGAVFADYARPGEALGCMEGGGGMPSDLQRTSLTIRSPINLQGRTIGTLDLLYDLDEISDRMKLYGGIVVTVLLASSLIAFLLSSRLRALIATPITQLVRVATAVSETGEYSARAERVSRDELGVLVDRFNEMLATIQSRDGKLTKALAEREEALREVESARQRFHFMAESMPQKIFTATRSGAMEYFNRQWEAFTGLPLEQIQKRGWSGFLHPGDLEENRRAWDVAIETGEPFLREHRFRRADGSYRWHLTRALPMQDAQAGTSMWIGSSTEIHEQKETEAELRRANDDLQQFAYSASHDLQEPIRNVAIYSEVIARQYHDSLDSKGRQFLGFLTEGGRRLAALVDDLLAYTRAGQIEVNPPAVEAEAGLRLALSDLAETIRENEATVTFDSLPAVNMSPVHLQQVFQNLIGNAVKYRNQEPPRIYVSARQDGAAWRFAVQDNGIGIEPQYKERIFGVFKRLHRDEKYSGTGIGLAICQRVVSRYGGRIWVESELGKGATFCFTIPRRMPRISNEPVDPVAG